MLQRALCIAVLIGLATSCSPLPDSRPIEAQTITLSNSDTRRYLLTGPLSDNRSIVVSIETETYSKAKHGPHNYDGSGPFTIITGLTIEDGPFSTRVPARIVRDLTDPHRELTRLFETPEQIILEISGADGAAAYTTRLHFSKTDLTLRTTSTLDRHTQQWLPHP